MKYSIKQVPEDFIVRELSCVSYADKFYTHKSVSADNSVSAGCDDSAYKYFIGILTKHNTTTQHAIEQLAQFLKIKHSFIGFAGTKDKKAITSQIISIKITGNARKSIGKYTEKKEKQGAGKTEKQLPEKIILKNCEFELLGMSQQPVSLGDLYGNEFEIVVRNLEKNFELKKGNIPEFFPNYFDEQRFSEKNVEVGLAILRADFKCAAGLIVESGGRYADKISRFLEQNRNDYVGAMKNAVPKKTLMMYIHSVQSLIFNKAVSEYLSQKCRCKSVQYSQGILRFPVEPVNIEPVKRETEPLEAPLFGFGSGLCSEPGSNEANNINIITKRIVAELGLTERSFVIKGMPELSSEGGSRKVFVRLENLAISAPIVDELNPEKSKVVLKFFLPKGSYATIIVKGMFE